MLFYRKVFVKREPEEGRKLPKLIIRKEFRWKQQEESYGHFICNRKGESR